MTKNYLLFLFSLITAGIAGAQTYCSTSYPNGCGSESITNVTFVGINNTTSCGAGSYTDFTSGTAAVVASGLTYQLSVNLVVDFADYASAWIDWNGNGDFTDPGEEFAIVANTGTGGVYSVNVTVPGTATPGTTRMRVAIRWNSVPIPCNTAGWGEAEDYAVTILPPVLTAIAADTIELSCFGDQTDIPLQIFGGTAPYDLEWSTGKVDTGSVDTLTGAVAGAYSVTVTDANGDMDTAEIYITEPPVLSTSVNILADIVCDYDIGSAEVVATGGTPSATNYIVDLNGTFAPDTSMAGTVVNLGDDQVSSALPIGFPFEFFGDVHTEFRIGSNGYITFDAGGSGYGQTLPNASAPNNLIALNWEDLDPNGGTDGEINYYTIGTAPNRVLIVNFIDVPYWLGAIGDVTVQVKLFETTNCIEIHTAHVESDDNQTQGIENQDGSVAYTYPGRNGQSWNGGPDFISFCPNEYNYLWSSGSVMPIDDGLTAGISYVTVTDGNGCEAVDSVSFAVQSNIQSNIAITNVSCFGFGDGEIDLGISGGAEPYSYTWNNSTTNATIEGSGPGVFTVTVTDDLNCMKVYDNIEILEPALLQASVVEINNVTCPGDTTGSAKVITTGGVGPYAYSWTPSGSTVANPDKLTDGNYQVHIVDASGCNAFETVTIIALNDLPVVDLGDDIQHTDGSPVTLEAMTDGTTYLWSTGETTSSIEVDVTGTYSVTVENGAECASSDEVYVEIWALGVEDDAKSGVLSVYPNPTSGSITVLLPTDFIKGNVIVTDISGRKVMQAPVSTSSSTFDLAGLSSGTYNVMILGDTKTYRTKVVLH